MTDLRPAPTRDDLLGDPRLKLLLDASVDAIVVLGNDLEVLWANPGTERLLGWSPEEFMALDVLSLLHPDDLDESAALLERMMDGIEDDPPIVVRLRTAWNSETWVEIKGSDLRGVPGVEGVVLTARDVSNRFELEEALRGSQRRFEALVRHSNDGIVILDEEMRLSYVSPSIEKLTGYEPAAILGADASAIVLEPQRAELLEAFARVLDSSGTVESLRVRVSCRNGELRWMEVRVSNRFDDPAIAGVIANIRDVTDVVAAEIEAARLTEISDLTDDLVLIIAADETLQYMNPACARFLGLAPDEIPLGKVWQRLVPERSEGERRTVREGARHWTTEVAVAGVDGVVVPFSVQVIAHRNADGVLHRYSVVAHDISESKRLAATLERQALHDPLTGLPNRTHLERRLRQIASGPDLATDPVAVLFIDLDHFKVINDSLGHEFGDKLLKGVAARLVSLVRPEDLVARFGGDEFVVLCDSIRTGERAERLAERISTAMLDPLDIDGNPVYASVSVGIAQARLDGSMIDPGVLIRDADTAMYQAKSEGRGRYVRFDEDMRRKAVERQRIELALRQATTDGSLELHYQPIVELATGRLVSLEALIRWRRDGELVSPDEFIPIAEETGQIVTLGQWVLESACRYLGSCRALPGWDHLRMSVNVSARQLQLEDFAATLADVLHRTGTDPGSVTLEITESVLLHDVDLMVKTLDRLRSLGVSLAIDDFGTGYSSLTYLDRLPVDIVKLDRTFLESAASDVERNRLVGGVIQLVRTIELSCVAEGIESDAQYQLLAGLGCARGQGFHIAPPLDAEGLTRCLGAVAAGEPWPRGNCGTPAGQVPGAVGEPGS